VPRRTPPAWTRSSNRATPSPPRSSHLEWPMTTSQRSAKGGSRPCAPGSLWPPSLPWPLDWRWVRRPLPHDRAGQEGHVHDQCRKSPDREKDMPAQGKEPPRAGRERGNTSTNTSPPTQRRGRGACLHQLRRRPCQRGDALNSERSVSWRPNWPTRSNSCRAGCPSEALRIRRRAEWCCGNSDALRAKELCVDVS
jgi:hypothetical protein